MTPLAAAVMSAISWIAVAPSAMAAAAATGEDSGSAGAYEFNAAFLMGMGGGADLSRYQYGNPVDPGVYLLDIAVNGTVVDRREVIFMAGADPDRAQPCLTPELLLQAGLKPEYLSDTAASEPQACVDLLAQVSDARVEYDSQKLRLNLSLPQVSMVKLARGAVGAEHWDSGVTAGMLDYNLNGQRSGDRTTGYLGLTAGLNLGAWRFRHRASFSHSSVNGTRHQTISSYAQRALPAWRSELLIGEGNTRGELFDSVGFTGLQLASDERMLPDALRGYAPVVRGVAQTQATVHIEQNGYEIYSQSVAPGPFVIDDLYPTSFGGDLQVIVRETNGSEQRFSVSFAAVPQALREGVSRYNVTAGKLRDPNGFLAEPWFAQGSYARGINNTFTLISGAQLSDGYASTLGGAAINTSVGAFGADMTYATARAPVGATGQGVQGSSLRVNYQRNLQDIGTNIGVAAYRYSTSGYLTLHEAARWRHPSPGTVPDTESGRWAALPRAKQRLQLNLSQTVGQRSSLSFNGGYVSYWDPGEAASQAQTDYSLSFQSQWRDNTYSLAAMRTRDARGRNDNQFQLTFQRALGRSSRAPRLSSTLQHDGSANAGVFGRLGEHGDLSYNLGATHIAGQHSLGGNANLQWQTPFADLSAGVARTGAGNSSFAAGASGSLLWHAGGLNAGPSLGDTPALIEAPGATGARVSSGHAIRVGRNGYAVLPSLSPYRWNTVSLDPTGLPLDVELQQSSQRVAPTAGAVVKVPFRTQVDPHIFVRVADADGRPLPWFGAEARDAQGNAVGQLSQGGVLQTRGVIGIGQLTLHGPDATACQIEVATPEPDARGMRWAHARCQDLRLETAEQDPLFTPESASLPVDPSLTEIQS